MRKVHLGVIAPPPLDDQPSVNQLRKLTMGSEYYGVTRDSSVTPWRCYARIDYVRCQMPLSQPFKPVNELSCQVLNRLADSVRIQLLISKCSNIDIVMVGN